MSKKRDRDLENMQRREEVKRKRVERVVTAYIQLCHPEIYDQAYGFYQQLDSVHPDKKDLRKTAAFLALKHEHTSKPVKRVRHTMEKTTDNMLLRIPLMQRKTTVHETTVHETTVEMVDLSPAKETVDLSPAKETVDLPPAKETVDLPPAKETVDLPPAKETMTNLLPIDDDTLEEIMADLQQDPDIQSFFENMDFQDDDCPLW